MGLDAGWSVDELTRIKAANELDMYEIRLRNKVRRKIGLVRPRSVKGVEA